MRLVVVGASGRTGLRVVDAALAQDLDVVALVRDPAKLGHRAERVCVVTGDARDAESLRAAVRTGDAVVSALGQTRNDADDQALALATLALVSAMQAVGASRLLAVVGAGVLLTNDGVPRHSLPDYPHAFRRISVQHQAVLAACERSSLSWMVVGCPRIVDAEATGSLRTLRDHLPPGLDQVTTGDLAELLVREAVSPTFERTRVGVNQAR